MMQTLLNVDLKSMSSFYCCWIILVVVASFFTGSTDETDLTSSGEFGYNYISLFLFLLVSTKLLSLLLSIFYTFSSLFPSLFSIILSSKALLFLICFNPFYFQKFKSFFLYEARDLNLDVHVLSDTRTENSSEFEKQLLFIMDEVDWSWRMLRRVLCWVWILFRRGLMRSRLMTEPSCWQSLVRMRPCDCKLRLLS